MQWNRTSFITTRTHCLYLYTVVYELLAREGVKQNSRDHLKDILETPTCAVLVEIRSSEITIFCFIHCRSES